MCGLVLVGWIVDGHVRVFVWLCGCVVVCAGAAAAGLFLRKVVPLRRETAARERAQAASRVEGLIAVTKKDARPKPTRHSHTR